MDKVTKSKDYIVQFLALIRFSLLFMLVLSSEVLSGTTDIVSISESGEQSNGYSVNWSLNNALSADGRLVVFKSAATNLHPLDNDAVYDIYVYDKATGKIDLVSQNGTNVKGNGNSSFPTISADGRYVAFKSESTNLIANDTDTISDIYVFDRKMSKIELVSVSSDGIKANHGSHGPMISADGNYVAFHSNASNLHPDDPNPIPDIYVYDRVNQVIELISRSVERSNGNSYRAQISGDGKFVVFDSIATNLSPDDIDSYSDIYLFNRVDKTLELISKSNEGDPTVNAKGNLGPAISSNGKIITFYSYSTMLVPDDSDQFSDVFIYDINANEIELISRSNTDIKGNNTSLGPSISEDGRFVVFDSKASNLSEDDIDSGYDVYRYDRLNKSIELISKSTDGTKGNSSSRYSVVSGSGNSVMFSSTATNLVEVDENHQSDVFVHYVTVEDSDQDGVLDINDQCPETQNEIVDDNTGCSIPQLCPCEAKLDLSSWRNNGEYLQCITSTAKYFSELEFY